MLMHIFGMCLLRCAYLVISFSVLLFVLSQLIDARTCHVMFVDNRHLGFAESGFGGHIENSCAKRRHNDKGTNNMIMLVQ